MARGPAAPRWRGTAHLTTAQISERVSEARELQRPIRIRGNGNWMGAGRPCAAREILSLEGDSEVVAYVPDDLTITVRAGATLDEIDSVTRAHGQWLPLDPPGLRSGTIGATIATASSGPLSHGYGLARDLILGIEFVNGRAEPIRSGGRVVKNVAGFDMMRLLCGSWGSLGIITELTLRLYALPSEDRTISLPAGGSVAAIRETSTALRDAHVAPIAMDLVNAAIAAHIGLGDEDLVLVRLAGNRAMVGKQLDTLRAIGSITECDQDCWKRLAELDANSKLAFRLGALPTAMPDIWELALQFPDAALSVSSTFSRGVVRVTAAEIPPAVSVDGLPLRLEGGTSVFELLPPALWAELALSAPGSRLERAVKSAFDPDGVLNSGILID